MKRKLLFVVNMDRFFMSHRLSIALAAKQQGFDVHVATRFTNCLDKMQALGLTVHPLHLDRSSTGAVSNGLTFFQILRVFIRVKPDIVHLVTIKPVLLGGLAARLASVPSVVAAISGLGFVFLSHGIKARIRRGLASLLYRLALGHGNMLVIFQNKDDCASVIALSRMSEEKVRFIRGSGVDLDSYRPSLTSEEKPIVVLAARLLIDKGVREFVQAAQMLQNSGSLARFVLVGDPDPDNPATIPNDELEQWVSDEVIEWWGHRQDIPQIFASAYMVVLPSYREGLPKVLIEAAACGRVVVTTDVPGCRDAIDPGVTGILVPVRNSEALAGGIKKLLDNPSLGKEMGRAGRQLAERSFDVRQVEEQHMRIYDELLQ